MTLQRGQKSLNLSLIDKDDVVKTLKNWKKELEDFCKNAAADITTIVNEPSVDVNWEPTKVEIASTPYAVQVTDGFLVTTISSSGYIEINLPAASTVNAGHIIVIRGAYGDEGSGSGWGVDINPNGSDTVDDYWPGGTAIGVRIQTNYGWVIMRCNGVDGWEVIAGGHKSGYDYLT